MQVTRRQIVLGVGAASLGVGGYEVGKERLGNAQVMADAGPPGSKHAYCLGKLNYFEGNYPFIDRTKSGTGFNNGSGTRVFDAKGWLTTLGPGAHAQAMVAAGASWFPPGDYKVVSTSRATLSLDRSPGISNVVSGVGLCTFTVEDLGDAEAWLDFVLKINVVNRTSENIAVTDLKCHLGAHQALLDAGEIFDPDYLAGIAGARVLRSCEWFGQNQPGGNPVDGLWKFSDYGVQDEDKTSYAPFAGTGGPCVSIFLKLCRKVGARPWINIGNAGNLALCNYTHADNLLRPARWNDHAAPGVNRFSNGVGVRLATTHNPKAFIGDFDPVRTTKYVVNATDSTFQLADTIDGPPLKLAGVDMRTDSGDFNFALWAQVTQLDEMNDMFLPFARACHDADPDAHPLVEYSNEVWNGLYGVHPYTTYITSGVLLGDAFTSTGYLWQALKCWKAFETVYPPAQVGRVIAWFTGTLEGHLSMTAKGGHGLTRMDPGVYDPSKTFGEIILQAPERCYYAVATYINLDDGTGHAGPGVYSAPVAYAANGSSTNYSDSFWDSQFERSIAYNSDHKMAGMKAIRKSLATHLPGVRLCMYEWGQQAVWGHGVAADAKWKATAQSLSAYLESDAGRAMYERAWARNIAPYNLDFVNFYNSEGSRGHTATSFSHWGIRNRNTDNPASIWFRTK